MYPDFTKKFLIYVDGSKEFGFSVAIHQIAEDGIEPPVPFLSKAPTLAERNHGATELECIALVWALHKLLQYTDGEFVVNTDHSASVHTLTGQISKPERLA